MTPSAPLRDAEDPFGHPGDSLFPHRISNASNFMHHQLPVTILPNEPQPKEDSPADNPMDLVTASHRTPE
uniref:Uncharacterized protein n=1 Tax=Romanomermis culicivorax TaxID=13658 RepID=A0A915HPM5_ROMCU